MTKKELKQRAREILGGARKHPTLPDEYTMEQYKEFWDGKRMGICELLKIDHCLRFTEFPFPWEKGGERG